MHSEDIEGYEGAAGGEDRGPSVSCREAKLGIGGIGEMGRYVSAVSFYPKNTDFAC